MTYETAPVFDALTGKRRRFINYLHLLQVIMPIMSSTKYYLHLLHVIIHLL